MNGLMMDSPLTITSIMEHADRIHGASEIVSFTMDNPQHRYTYRDSFKRIRQLANALDEVGFKKGDRIATLAWNDYRHFELYRQLFRRKHIIIFFYLAFEIEALLHI